jgi:hypothetical protein
MMAATVRVRREGFGIELRRGKFDIAVDGENAGSVERQNPVEVPVEPGHHTLQITAGRYSSRERSFDVADGDMVSFRCHGANIWPLYVASIFKPDLAISLRRE